MYLPYIKYKKFQNNSYPANTLSHCSIFSASHYVPICDFKHCNSIS